MGDNQKGLSGKDNANETIIIDDRNSFRIIGFEISKIKWRNVVFLLCLHVLAIYGFVWALITQIRFFTAIFAITLSLLTGLAITVGGHRLWAHRSFEARLPLKIFLLIFQTMACNGSALSFARDHRTHHKWSDQEPDPKNSSRGLFYAHTGWWLLKKNQIVKDYGNKLNFDDLYDDILLKYQHKFYTPLAILLGFVFPTVIPWLLWSESLWTSFLVCGCLRVFICLEHYFALNSLAHGLGGRPFNRSIRPTNNMFVNLISLGEGSHNYHHTFPYDYNGGEHKFWEWYNPSTVLIEICHCLGLAHHLKRPSPQLVWNVAQERGNPKYLQTVGQRGLMIRMIYGLVTWTLGIVMSFWPFWTIIVFKVLTGRNLIVLDQSMQAYTWWLKRLPLPDNFVVYN